MLCFSTCAKPTIEPPLKIGEDYSKKKEIATCAHVFERFSFLEIAVCLFDCLMVTFAQATLLSRDMSGR